MLILDNFEQLLEGATIPSQLLEACPFLRVIVTSRERLNLGEEHVLTLSGLPVPTAGTDPGDFAFVEAVQLFVQRAKKATLSFSLGAETQEQVVRLVRLVEGFPLGIELAAAWVRVLLPADIVVEIESNLDFLASASPSVVDRHRSVRAAFEHSWKLLGARDQDVLGKLSVFRGGFRREAASEVAGATLTSLVSLVDKSLLRVLPDGRFDRHALLVRFTQEKLAEQPEERAEILERHGLYYHSFLREHSLELSSMNRYKQARALLTAEIPNIQTAWDWAIDQQKHEQLKRSAYSFSGIHRGRGQEGFELFSRAVAGLDEGNREHHAALGYALLGQCSHGQGVNSELSQGSLERALELLRPIGEDLGVAWALAKLGPDEAYYLHDLEKGRAYLDEGLALARRAGSPHLVGLTLLILANLEGRLGSNVEASRRLFEETLRELRELGDPELQALLLSYFGLFLVENEFLDEGKARLRESLELSREYQFDHQRDFGAGIFLARAAWYSGDLEEAERLSVEQLERARNFGYRIGAAQCLKVLGAVATERGKFAEAEGYLMEALRVLSGNETLLMGHLLVVQLLGELRLAEGALVAGAEWLSFVVHHAASGSRAGAKCQRLLKDLRDQVPPEELAAAVERGEELVFDDVLSGLRPEL